MEMLGTIIFINVIDIQTRDNMTSKQNNKNTTVYGSIHSDAKNGTHMDIFHTQFNHLLWSLFSNETTTLQSSRPTQK
jgi:hypothetical protein